MLSSKSCLKNYIIFFNSLGYIYCLLIVRKLFQTLAASFSHANVMIKLLKASGLRSPFDVAYSNNELVVYYLVIDLFIIVCSYQSGIAFIFKEVCI